MKKKKIIVLATILVVGLFLSLISFVYKKYPYLFYNNENNVIVLAYHHFVPKEEKQYYSDNGFVITVDEFEEQLKYLKKRKYNPITLEELYCWKKKECSLPKKSILITIDDGNLSTYKFALPLLEKYGFNGVAAVISSRVKLITDEWIPGESVFMGQDLIDEIKNNHKNLEIISHSHDLHRKINTLMPKEALTQEEIENDINISKDKLNTDYFVYPFGSYNDKYISALKNLGFKMAFSYGPFKSATIGDNDFIIPRISVNANTSLLKFKILLKK